MGFFDKLFGGGSSGSSVIAKDTLKLALAVDRMACSDETLRAIKADIMEVLKKYPQFNVPDAEIQLDQDNDTNRLSVSIPLLARARRAAR